MRVFVAHKRQLSSVAVDALQEAIEGAICSKGVETTVVTGRDHFADNAQALGGWQAWQQEVAAGSALDGEPLFHAIVVPDAAVGRATAGIVRAALEAGRPVLFWDGLAFARVSAIREDDSEDWRAGWSLDIDR